MDRKKIIILVAILFSIIMLFILDRVPPPNNYDEINMDYTILQEY